MIKMYYYYLLGHYPVEIPGTCINFVLIHFSRRIGKRTLAKGGKSYLGKGSTAPAKNGV